MVVQLGELPPDRYHVVVKESPTHCEREREEVQWYNAERLSGTRGLKYVIIYDFCKDTE